MPKPKNKKTASKREIRVNLAQQKFEIRKNADGTRSVKGYFATFGTMSRDIGFREVLQQGCFLDSLREQPVSCYRDHDPKMLLGKTTSKTLEVSEDSKGLAFRVTLPNTSYANDLVSLMQRGDSYECSFGFTPASDGDTWSQLPNGEILRTITKATLFEGSILTGPSAAYPNTSASLRRAPADIRAKLAKRTDTDDDDSEDPDLDCDGADADDPACEDRCECCCLACEEGDCDECTNSDCDDDDCEENDCPMQQTRAAHAALLTRRIRFS